ncbi:MAG: putative membrane protein [Candidatus Roizmanbacteria bacterium GW2011_GWC2_37_13]|uniref:Putative membrane protein n=1 Tax=Candidatus Roizmanbacteria bacterium GW2011_GWC2_37_13 TaxID=1618486 RepID=A0A0G0G249_9BACT|nr:MAG: putative membrane protein [Candidatus Roizmanbacteria bacterium GW2011_GWC1_37_12]KKQ25248.1 MAG: putative membrane protein [Candidatus Roizmanbacteria bacterium GW2011_GWC2_37_13]
MTNNKVQIKEFFLIFFILIIGFLFRFNNLNWDENFHLHPDERFLTMVGNAIVLPKNIGEYLDPKISKLNPNNINFNFFIYGDFPLILNKYLAVFTGKDNYNDFTILGRALSAYFDLLIIILVYKSAKLLFPNKKNVPFWSAFLYAVAVYPIQAAHFFTVDTFLNFFMFGSFYFALKEKNILSAVFFGLALASKISAIYIIPLILVVFLIKSPKKVFNIFIFFVITYFVLRLASPYYFLNSNLLDPRLNQTFVTSIKELKSFEGKDIWYPPAVQWMNKPISFVLINLMLVGVGPPYFILIIIGIYYLISKLNLKSGNFLLFIVFFWVLGYFVYLSFQFVKSIRYTIFLYPFFAIFAGISIDSVLKKIKNKKLFIICNLLFVILLLIWPLMFSSIYFHKNTRIEASEWIYKNLPNGSYILSESWDDSLPLSINNNYGKRFDGEQLPVFDPDTSEKWQKMNELFLKADYYILSSNRGWGSIPTVPEKYPKMSKFYNSLLKNENSQYKLIKEFNSYPSLRYLGIPLEFPDQWSDEAFTVFDHQKVIVFERKK